MSSEGIPTPPPEAHRAPDKADDTIKPYPHQKRDLMTWDMEGVKDEWKYGSKKRVVKYYAVATAGALAAGAIMIVVIWVIKRYA